MKSNELRTGQAINLDNQLQIVIATEHVKPGKGPAYVQAKLKNVATGSVSQKRFNTSDEVDAVSLDRRTVQYLYSDSGGHVFMDNESYDQFSIAADLLGDSMLYLKANAELTVLVYNDRPISIDLPTSVELQITETTPQPKGATATNQLKEATCETGLKTRVPPFIEVGEVVKIKTEDASYMGRA